MAAAEARLREETQPRLAHIPEICRCWLRPGGPLWESSRRRFAGEREPVRFQPVSG
jgi:hypothetical protein